MTKDYVTVPDLVQPCCPNLNVVQITTHRTHHLTAVAAGHTDVFARGMFPLRHQLFGGLVYKPHTGGGHL